MCSFFIKLNLHHYMAIINYLYELPLITPSSQKNAGQDLRFSSFLYFMQHGTVYRNHGGVHYPFFSGQYRVVMF